MPDFSLAYGLQLFEDSDNGVDDGLIAVASSGSIDTKGSWVELIASADFDSSMLTLIINKGEQTSAQYLLDLAVGGAGSEETLIENVSYGVRPASDSDTSLSIVTLPMHVPSGSRISARISVDSNAPSSSEIMCHLHSSSLGESYNMGAALEIGADEANTQGTTVTTSGTTHTKGSYSQIVASTDRDAQGFFFSATLDGVDVLTSSTRILYDIAIGAASSEEVIVENHLIGFDNVDEWNNMTVYFPVAIAKGSRVAVRAQTANTTQAQTSRVVIGLL